MSARVLSEIPREKLEEVLNASSSVAEVLRRLGLRVHTAYYRYLEKRIMEEGLVWKREPVYGQGKKIPLSKILVKGGPHHTFNPTRLKKKILDAGLLEEKCQVCGLGPTWQNQRLSLHMDHVNGDREDNRLSNLRMLCPNCHSQTSTYCGKKNKGRKWSAKTPKPRSKPKKTQPKPRTKKPRTRTLYPCPRCLIKRMTAKTAKTCGVCRPLEARRVRRPPLDTLRKDIEELGYCGTGRKYGVSDNAIRKWLKTTI